MKYSRLWLIPAICFLIACSVNLYGCLIHNLTVEYYVKGAIMPLLALTGMAYMAPRGFNVRTAGILVLAQLLGWAGDSLLMGRGSIVWFASGLGAFLLGHICYLCLFTRTLKGLSPMKWVVAVAVMVAVMVGVVLAIGINGVLLAPMTIYGLALLTVAFCGVSGIFRSTAPSRRTWWMVLAGAFLFLGSDSLIAMRTFGEVSASKIGFYVMSTYIVAQSLLCAAGVSLAVNDKK